TVTADIRGLDGISWGDVPSPALDYPSETADPIAVTDTLVPPPSGSSNIELWRAWAEIALGDHTIRFGRMPLNWGSGVWQNDGLGYNADYGDSADRVQWEGLFGSVYTSAAIDVNAEGLLAARDD